jgi:hypothetical protein
MLPTVIEGPARVAGLRLEPELVPRLVEDTGSGDALPLLAFTLRELSEGVPRGGTITLARYAALGGVQGALSRHADAALAAAVTRTGLPEREVLAGLVRLLTIDDAGRWSRRRVRMDSLPERLRGALQVLVDRRLLVIDSGDAGTATVTVAHEALLTAWQPLHASRSVSTLHLGDQPVVLQQRVQRVLRAGHPRAVPPGVHRHEVRALRRALRGGPREAQSGVQPPG